MPVVQANTTTITRQDDEWQEKFRYTGSGLGVSHLTAPANTASFSASALMQQFKR